MWDLLQNKPVGGEQVGGGEEGRLSMYVVVVSEIEGFGFIIIVSLLLYRYKIFHNEKHKEETS